MAGIWGEKLRNRQWGRKTRMCSLCLCLHMLLWKKKGLLTLFPSPFYSGHGFLGGKNFYKILQALGPAVSYWALERPDWAPRLSDHFWLDCFLLKKSSWRWCPSHSCSISASVAVGLCVQFGSRDVWRDISIPILVPMEFAQCFCGWLLFKVPYQDNIIFI